eukprot:Nk52_evm36s270 gene=Nk52_evmTU36s270
MTDRLCSEQAESLTKVEIGNEGAVQDPAEVNAGPTKSCNLEATDSKNSKELEDKLSSVYSTLRSASKTLRQLEAQKFKRNLEGKELDRDALNDFDINEYQSKFEPLVCSSPASPMKSSFTVSRSVNEWDVPHMEQPKLTYTRANTYSSKFVGKCCNCFYRKSKQFPYIANSRRTHLVSKSIRKAPRFRNIVLKLQNS